jgi:hypothetical protein
MPKSKVRKKATPRAIERPDHLVAEEDDQPSPRHRFQAIVGATIAVLLVLAMVVSAILPFINWR